MKNAKRRKSARAMAKRFYGWGRLGLERHGLNPAPTGTPPREPAKPPRRLPATAVAPRKWVRA